MKWIKLGHVFVADNLSNHLSTHASNPVALVLSEKQVRVFYSGRDSNERSSIGYVDLQVSGNKVKVLSTPKTPVLTPGLTGTFDDSGVSMGCILRIQGKYWLYYLGWNLGVTVPWRNSIGLATSNDGVNFQRVHLAPILDRNCVDPFSLSYPWVMKEGCHWHMWYGSNLNWGAEQKDMDHLIKYASSLNGTEWSRNGDIAVNFKDQDEYAISKPCVIKENGTYKMWYSFRGESYRIGYAESTNAIAFQRKDELAGIEVSTSGWDSQSVEYPCIFDLGKQRYMLYNGDRYGLTGFGIAMLESSHA